MKFWSAAIPHAQSNLTSAKAALVVMASLCALPVYADEPAKAPAAQPAAPAPAAKPATPPPAVAKPSQPAAPAVQAAAVAAKVKPKPAAPSESPECVRTGQRVIAALARDDSGAASQFHNFYEAFKCPPLHLAQAFGCLVNLQAANPGLNNPSPEQVNHCWNDPTTLPKVEAPKPPEEQGPK